MPLLLYISDIIVLVRKYNNVLWNDTA